MTPVRVRQNRIPHLLAGVLLVAFLDVAPALAQVDEIVITATRREQSLQDVPLAVSAYSSDFLRKTGVDDIQEVANLSPSFQATTNSSETQGLVIRIRGIGTQGNNPAFESAVGVFIDGVYRSRPGAALSEMQDVERLEVLRGPQGTLFGRNTSAGALNIVTAGPSFEFDAYAEGTYERADMNSGSNGYEGRAMVTGPLVDGVLAGRLSALYQTRDGYVEDYFTGQDYDDRDRYTIKGQLLFEPSADVSFRLIADYREQNEGCCYPVILGSGLRPDGTPDTSSAATVINNIGFGNGLTQQAQFDPARPFDRLASATPGEDLIQDVQDWGVSGELTWDLGFGTLTSVSAYRDFESDRASDIDFTAVDLLNNEELHNGIEIFTQEFRLQGKRAWLDWLIGGFYAKEKITTGGTVTHGRDYGDWLNGRLGGLLTLASGGAFTNFDTLASTLSGGMVAPGTGWADGTGSYGDEFESDNESFAIFTHNVISLSDSLNLTLGLRYNIDKKSAKSDLGTTNSPGCNAIQPFLNNPGLATSINSVLMNGDQRRIVDVFSALACLGLTSPAFEYDLDQDDEELTGTANLSYQLPDGTLTYASYSRGYKSGTVNLDRAGTILTRTGDISDPDNFLDPRVEPELVDAYELGLKSEFFNRKLQVNVALFWQDIENFQLNTFTGFSFVPESVEEATTRGVELEVQARPFEGLNLRGGVTYAQTDYGDNIQDITNILANERGFRLPGQELDERSDLAGNKLTNAPLWVFTGSATYTTLLPNSNLAGYVHGDFRYDAGYNTGSDLDPIKEQDGYTVVNAQLGLQDVDGRWELALWAKNLFDRDYQQIAFDLPLQSDNGYGTFLGDPRTYGVTARINF